MLYALVTKFFFLHFLEIQFEYFFLSNIIINNLIISWSCICKLSEKKLVSQTFRTETSFVSTVKLKKWVDVHLFE